MKRLSLISLLLSLLVLAGCQGGSTQAGAGTGTSGDPAKPDVSADSGGTTGGKEPTPAAVVIPDELKTDAYHWLGLGKDKPIKYSLTAPGVTMSGEQTIAANSEKDGKVTFKVSRTGELASTLGDEVWSLEKDGVYAISNTKMTTAVREMQAPSTMAPGKTWTVVSKTKMDNNGTVQDVAQNLSFKVIREESVTTPLGKQQALLVKANGTLKVGSESSRVEASFWYVKDKGMVKNVLKRSSTADPKADSTVITIEETK